MTLDSTNAGRAFKAAPYGEPAWAAAYTGIPFAERGFDQAGVHCWGLIWLHFARDRGIVLDRYGPLSARTVVKAARAIATAKALAPWRCVAALAPGEQSEDLIGRACATRVLRMSDVVVMLNGDATCESHVGLMIGQRLMLHTEANCNTVKVDLMHATVRWRVTGFYRHENLVGVS